MNRVLLVGRLTRDPDLRTLPSGKPLASVNNAEYTNEHVLLSCGVPTPLPCGSGLAWRH
jgi:Single-strand binding protein family